MLSLLSLLGPQASAVATAVADATARALASAKCCGQAAVIAKGKATAFETKVATATANGELLLQNGRARQLC